MSYKPQQIVFHKDDIPEEKRNRKNEVKQWAQSNLLSAEQPSWNKSTANQRPVWDKKKFEILRQDRSNAFQYNFRSETLPPTMVPPIDKPSKFHVSAQLDSDIKEIERKRSSDPVFRGTFRRTEELPTHPNLSSAKPWNPSTEFLPDDKEKSLKELEKKAMMNSIKKKSSLSEEYISPEVIARKVGEEVRRQKQLGTFSVEHKVFQPPPEPVDRASLKNRYAIEASRKYKTSHHSGVWEFNNAEGRYMWSDTGSFEYESPGDIVKVHNPDAYIMTGPTLAPTSLNNPRRINLIRPTEEMKQS